MLLTYFNNNDNVSVGIQVNISTELGHMAELVQYWTTCDLMRKFGAKHLF